MQPAAPFGKTQQDTETGNQRQEIKPLRAHRSNACSYREQAQRNQRTIAVSVAHQQHQQQQHGNRSCHCRSDLQYILRPHWRMPDGRLIITRCHTACKRKACADQHENSPSVRPSPVAKNEFDHSTTQPPARTVADTASHKADRHVMTAQTAANNKPK